MNIFKQNNMLKIEISGTEVLRFLNLCKNIQIHLRNIEFINEKTVQAELSFAEFFRIKTIRKKTGVKVHILKKKGIWISGKKIAAYKFFLVSALSCFLLLWNFSGCLWEIQIHGNLKNTDMQILSQMQQEGITHGMRTKNISCSMIAKKLRAAFSNVAWVSVKKKGVCLLVDIKEIVLPQESPPTGNASSLSAPFDGKIVSMITRAGTPLKKAGDFCESGEILVLGEVPLYNDSQEKTGTVGVFADADIYIERKQYYYDTFSMVRKTHKRGELLGKQYFLILHDRWFFGTIGKWKEEQEHLMEVKKYKLTESLYFPISFGYVKNWKILTRDDTYTKKEAMALAKRRLMEYQEKLLEKGVQISENNVKIEMNYAKCTAQGNLVVIEKNVNRVPVTRIQKTERTSKDG